MQANDRCQSALRHSVSVRGSDGQKQNRDFWQNHRLVGAVGRLLPSVASALLGVTTWLGVSATSQAQPPAPPSALMGRPTAAPVGASPTAAPAPQPRAEKLSRVVISDVIIRGNKHLSTEFIRGRLTTKPGQEYIPAIVQEDTRQLYSTRQFGNVTATTAEDGPGRVQVTFHVRDYPSLVEKVEYKGNVHVNIENLEQITGIRKGQACNPVANKLACNRIVQHYANEEGRPFASCDLIQGGEMGDTEVIFNITEGPKVRISDIVFKGNSSFATGAMLKTHIQSSGKVLGLFGGTYNAAMLEYDQGELLRYYRSFGFHDVRIGRELIYDANGRDVTVVFHIHEGVRYRLADTPQVEGVRSIAREALEAQHKMKAGQFYNQATIDGDLARIKDMVGYRGIEARAQAVPVYSPDKPGIVQMRYEVQESQPARVGQIIIVGNERTKSNVILRQVPIYPGQVLSYPDLKQAERNLARLNIFDATPDGSVRPTVTVLENFNDPNNPNPYRDILISVNEASTGSLMFGLGVNSDAGLTGQIVLNERNFDIMRLPTSFDDLLNGAFRGAGQELRIEAVPGTQMQRYMVSFREPFLLDSPYSLTVSGYYYQRFFNEYLEDRLGGRVTIGRKVSDYWSVLATARLENVEVKNVPVYAPKDYTSVVGGNFLAGLRIGAVRDSRDSMLRPTEGSLIDLSYEQVTGDATFPLINAEYTQYWTVWQREDGTGRHVVSFHTQLGWAGTNTPVYERYFAGGFRSLRGFQFRGVGPDDRGFKVGGDFLFMNSLEYQLPIRAGDNVSLVGFVDSGTVSRRLDDWETYRVSVGFGVRLMVPMLGPVPIALDFGFPIVKGQFDNQQVFNFFMGWTR